MKRHDFPLTSYICDLVHFQMGRLTPDDIRERWRQGVYAGVKPEWAAAYAKLHGVR